MSLTLYFHPLSSFSQKTLIAFYENGTAFTPQILDMMDESVHADFRKLWPVGKFPVLRDDAKDRTIPESSTIIEYLARNYPGEIRLIPKDPDLAGQVRLWDRFHDLYVNVPLQKIVTDRLRPPDAHDPFGVGEAKDLLRRAYITIDREMAAKTWAAGEEFTLADCAAAPSLRYASMVLPFADTHPNIAAYLDRLLKRPSFARVVEEALPYAGMFPGE